MKPILYQRAPFERLTKEPSQYFFGYYDLNSYSSNKKYHLCHKVDFASRLPKCTDICELGMIRLYDREYIKLDTTTAWNFQQGSMLQYNPAASDSEIIYNTIINGEYKSVIKNIETGEKKILPLPVANVNSTGTKALSINFARLHDFRPGYGYDGIADRFRDEDRPVEDGVFLMDIKNSTFKLIASTEELYEFAVSKLKTNEYENWKFLINHITFNPSSSRMVVLLRGHEKNFKTVYPSKWITLTITMDDSGGDKFLLLDDLASHYHWRDDENILFYAKTWKEHIWGMHLFKDKSHEYMTFDKAKTMESDGHISFSPCRKYILNDSYPKNGYRTLYLHDIANDKTINIADVLSVPANLLEYSDIRCDLHPRWNNDSTAFSFDSVHEGHRHIYQVLLEDIL